MTGTKGGTEGVECSLGVVSEIMTKYVPLSLRTIPEKRPRAFRGLLVIDVTHLGSRLGLGMITLHEMKKRMDVCFGAQLASTFLEIHTVNNSLGRESGLNS